METQSEVALWVGLPARCNHRRKSIPKTVRVEAHGDAPIFGLSQEPTIMTELKKESWLLEEWNPWGSLLDN